MKKNSFSILLLSFAIVAGCSNDDPVTPPPGSGEVLLAEVSFDSVAVLAGFFSVTKSITSGSLDFTDRDSARISFYYSGVNSVPLFLIYYLNGQSDTILYNGISLNISAQEQFANITVPSQKINKFFVYQLGTSSPGYSYFKFRDLKIYKK